MKSNLDERLLENCAKTAKEIRIWVGNKTNPEHYKDVKNLELTQSFLHTLDLLETVFIRFEISTFMAREALKLIGQSTEEGSLGFEFWQIDIEEYFASNLLELCHQLSNAYRKLKEFADKEKAFLIFTKNLPTVSDTLIARHHATHFVPEQFLKHNIAQQYSILRRPYKVVNESLEKELGRDTMPKVAKLLTDSVTESYQYLTLFREATIG